MLLNLAFGKDQQPETAHNHKKTTRANAIGDEKSLLRGVPLPINSVLNGTTHTASSHALPTHHTPKTQHTISKTYQTRRFIMTTKGRCLQNYIHKQQIEQTRILNNCISNRKTTPATEPTHRPTCTPSTGDSSASPAREVSKSPKVMATSNPADPIYNLDPHPVFTPQGKDPQDIFVMNKSPTVDPFTRTSDPQNPACLQILLDQIKVSTDLTTGERTAVEQLITEFANCFVLSMGEVIPVADAIHCLNI